MKYHYDHKQVLGESYYEINKSKFIGYLVQVNSVNEFKQHWYNIATLNPKAHHICFAYKINDDGLKAKAHDDGEPKGTAGYPILNLLEKHNFNNVCLYVVRYFGGTKLGAGPLLRSYVKAASTAIHEYQNKQQK